MSLVQALQYELSAQIPRSSSSHQEPQLQPSMDTMPATSDHQNGFQDDIVDENTPIPAEVARRVFDVAPLNVMNKSRRVVITSLVIFSNLVQMIVNFVGVSGGMKLGDALGVTQAQATWIAASYALTQGTFVLISGRLGAVYGHKNLLLIGGAWLTVRALSGVGGAFILPNAVAMITITNPPGRVRNLSLAFFGASAPAGGYIGAVLLGVFLEATEWKWLFVFIAALGAATFLPLSAILPKEVPVDREGKIDWVGAGLGTCALILFNFVWNQAPSVGWSTAYEIALLVLSVVLFASFVIWEKRFTPHPIMPLDIFKAPSFSALILVVLLNYMAVGTLIWYQILWLEEAWNWSSLQFAVGWTPFLIFGTGAAGLAAWLIPRLAAQWILAIGTITILVSNLLMATMPPQQTYWAQVFPSVILFAFCPDLVYTAAQIIASNAVNRHQQGVAGSLIGTLNLYGNSLGLGFASTVETEIRRRTQSTIMGYKAALYFGAGISVIALVLDLLFVRLVKDDREGWQNANDMDPADEIELTSSAAATGTQLPTASQRAT
ncbi:hypothetical protein DTO164E3_2550 [Paecilomyces variotii]|nr:hypothetical protein DTO164E3_2550 [Paecilomyces variotii]KAJ9208604.1 hypothetical protein DTO032I3_581 [Paecilomyces variotii]KAJ9232080.1 hypothetical protein DTO166G5_6408 [Paecilomyces variotii]KAJ9282447.1 hypothetical protein DTO021D3_595 [Paecilomyces variotii]KAJ9301129.1 hypothetical protein DTO217A2_7700 [Paecilomyces variotii]